MGPGQPLRIIQQPHSYGVVCIDIAANNSYLATMSMVPEGSEENQALALWDLQGTQETPLVVAKVPKGDLQVQPKIEVLVPRSWCNAHGHCKQTRCVSRVENEGVGLACANACRFAYASITPRQRTRSSF